MTEVTGEDVASAALALDEARGDLERLESLLCGFVQLVCKRISVGRHDSEWCRISGESRLKDAKGLARALSEQGLDVERIWEVDDFVGARAVVVLPSDAKLLADGLMAATEVHLTDLSLKEVRDEESGYRAIHIKGWLDDGGKRVGCEIQVRTGTQDVFGVWSRSHLYRSESLAPVLVRLGKAQADHLAVIDESFEVIRELVNEYDVAPTAKTGSMAEESPPEVL